MAFILTRAFILSQVAQLGITPVELDAASIDTKMNVLSAVAMANSAATGQVTMQPALDNNAANLKLLNLQIAAFPPSPT